MSPAFCKVHPDTWVPCPYCEDAPVTGEGGLRAAVQQVTHVGPENPDRPGLDPRSYTVHTLDSHFTEDPCVVCAALAAPAPDTLPAPVNDGDVLYAGDKRWVRENGAWRVADDDDE